MVFTKDTVGSCSTQKYIYRYSTIVLLFQTTFFILGCIMLHGVNIDYYRMAQNFDEWAYGKY